MSPWHHPPSKIQIFSGAADCTDLKWGGPKQERPARVFFLSILSIQIIFEFYQREKLELSPLAKLRDCCITSVSSVVLEKFTYLDPLEIKNYKTIMKILINFLDFCHKTPKNYNWGIENFQSFENQKPLVILENLSILFFGGGLQIFSPFFSLKALNTTISILSDCNWYI